MPVDVPRAVFDQLVDRALASVPAQLLDACDNLIVDIADENPDDPGLLGLYDGIALTERGTDYSFVAPDTITVYRRPLGELAADEAELEHEIRVTVVHEIAHHFGIDDDRLHELGWS